MEPPALTARAVELVGSGAAERLVAVEAGRRWCRKPVESWSLGERMGDHVEQLLERGEVPIGGRAQRRLHEVVAREVDRVDAVHGRGRF